MKLRGAGVVAVLLASGGCATTHDFSGLFDEREFAWSAKEGAATLQGQAFARTMSGDVKYCAGVEIYLVPVTAYTRAIAAALQDGKRHFAPQPEAYKRYRRTTVGDGMGSFEFNKLPAGSWYVGCDLVWHVPTQLGLQATGAIVERRVDLKEGQIVRVVVTPDTMSVDAPGTALPASQKRPCANALWC